MLNTKQIEKLLTILNNTSHMEIDGKKLTSWTVDMGITFGFETVFRGEHYDDEGNGFEWDFCVNNFRTAEVTDNIITLHDIHGELCVIALFAITPKKIELE
jgi:hypothetical protein